MSTTGSYQASLHNTATCEICSRTPEQLRKIREDARVYEKEHGLLSLIVETLPKGTVQCRFCGFVWLPVIVHTKPVYTQFVVENVLEFVKECPSCHAKRPAK